MKVLVIGSGGREHALVWKLRQSPRISKTYCAPGNGGISGDAECVPADLKSVESLVAIANQLKPDLTVVGPELPLQMGVVDEFSRRGWPVFGPTKSAAQLESSKAFAKQFLQRHRIPTAHYAICTSNSEVKHELSRFSAPVVVKADGLAAGKGVVICKTKDEAAIAAGEMLSGKMVGEAGARVVIEECLQGDELSFLVLSDGERVSPLVAAQDHKRVGDGDTGPNTGGMGAYSFPGLLDEQMTQWLLQHVARPTVEGMKAEGMEYKGILYCGLMMAARGPMVLEFNCRFGDPETQPILMRMESDLVEAMEASIEGRVSDGDFRWSQDAAVCVVMASGGYPGTIEVGKKIAGIENADALEGVKVFHAGTTARDNAYYSAGGRVLGVTARAADLKSAVDRAYEAVGKIQFDGAHYRKDVAARARKK
ncbi:MAG: phosphoribosylamine--glycine ligase [Acidobacteria bacterium]|nr:MAG: phosphoribosylamine--glycine ligase [Acidobacteriota bacterium]PYV73785.1 MAG: phosphoribosylamine--glycine ligase [Acidobacteriota bacterium]PYV74567.1 MAG: phosphoribosylamine--glycine ligase [Acidobacteriota bacterium]